MSHRLLEEDLVVTDTDVDNKEEDSSSSDEEEEKLNKVVDEFSKVHYRSETNTRTTPCKPRKDMNDNVHPVAPTPIDAEVQVIKDKQDKEDPSFTGKSASQKQRRVRVRSLQRQNLRFQSLTPESANTRMVVMTQTAAYSRMGLNTQLCSNFENGSTIALLNSTSY